MHIQKGMGPQALVFSVSRVFGYQGPLVETSSSFGYAFASKQKIVHSHFYQCLMKRTRFHISVIRFLFLEKNPAFPTGHPEVVGDTKMRANSHTQFQG